MPPRSRSALQRSVFFPPAYLSYLTVTAPELRGILKPFSFSLRESINELKALKYMLTDSLSAPLDLLKSRLNCLPYTLSLHACQSRKPHKPHKKTFIAAVVTCTSVHQSYRVSMTLVRQIFLQSSILNVPGENIPRRAIISSRHHVRPRQFKR